MDPADRLNRLVHTLKHFLVALAYTLAGMVIGAMGLYAYQVEQWPDLQPWHVASLDEEFRASQADAVTDLDDYRRLETRLFEQLQEQVIAVTPVGKGNRLNRYSAGSLVDPTNRPIDWNRTFEMAVDNPRGGILMLHGLSDSPYSVRALAKILHEQGFWVVGLRLPGHGTAPAGLTHATWQDFTAATRIAARHVRQRIGDDRPFTIMGYSNGAALAVEYSLAALEDKQLPAADSLVLLSPAIAVSPVAVLARWQERISHIPGLEKFAWTPILPEFDPYKYNSFAVNAGEQIYELTTIVERRLDRLADNGKLTQFPRVLAFQSAADSTIPPDAVVNRLLRRLTPNGHQLVLFDVNRFAEAESLLAADPESLTRALLKDPGLPFDLTVVTNQDRGTRAVVARRKKPQSSQITDEMLGISWPAGVYSLSHVALPFPPDDPLYGAVRDSDPNTIQLGSIELHGETGLLVVPGSYFLRLRHNPFFAYLQRRVEEMLIPNQRSEQRVTPL